MIRIRNNIFKKKKKSPHNENIKKLYNTFRNRINRDLKKSKVEYYSNYFEKNSNNAKETWQGIKSIVNIKNSNSKNVNQLNSNNGAIIDEPKLIAQTLNDFFVNVGPNTERSVPTNPVGKPETFLRNRNQFNFIVASISNEDILDVINQLENKSTGPNSIPGCFT